MKIVMLAAAACLLAIPALAHHSFAAEFDGKKSVKLEGTITKVEWTNPHIWMYLDVKDDSGNVVKWQCEGGAAQHAHQGRLEQRLAQAGRPGFARWLARQGRLEDV